MCFLTFRGERHVFSSYVVMINIINCDMVGLTNLTRASGTADGDVSACFRCGERSSRGG